jgi:hypothetical protein
MTGECSSGKRIYSSRKEGLKALNLQRRAIHKYGPRGGLRNAGKTVYRCKECGHWHMTSKKGEHD